jgi:hypothetical protein
MRAFIHFFRFLLVSPILGFALAAPGNAGELDPAAVVYKLPDQIQ